MLIPEISFQMRPGKDFSEPGGLIVRRSFSDSAASTSVLGTIYRIPGDKVLILSAASAIGDPDATQTCTRVNLECFEDDTVTSGTSYARAPEIQNAVAARFINLSWSGQMWVPPNGILRANAVFSAGVAVNFLVWGFFGVLVPRANIHES